MLFNKEEVVLLTAAVETYNDKDRNQMPLIAQRSLSISCLNKLEKFNSSTHFTKQELMFLELTIRFIKRSQYTSFGHHGQLLDQVISKLSKLSGT